jgi:hypothetical protein
MPKLGHITPSNFHKIMTMAQYQKTLKDPKEIDKFSVTAEKYAISICRGFLGVEDKEIHAKALEHGKTFEPFARECYEAHIWCAVPEIKSPIFHPKYKFICGIPDGLPDDGIVEIKCPENPDNHFINVTEGAQIEEYYMQMQGYMFITGRNWCDFVSYHPQYPDNHRFYCKRIARDNQFIEILETKIIAFSKLILLKMQRFDVAIFTDMKNLYI